MLHWVPVTTGPGAMHGRGTQRRQRHRRCDAAPSRPTSHPTRLHHRGGSLVTTGRASVSVVKRVHSAARCGGGQQQGRWCLRTGCEMARPKLCCTPVRWQKSAPVRLPLPGLEHGGFVGARVALVCRYGHTQSNTPYPIRTAKLSDCGPSQYWRGGPVGNRMVLYLFWPAGLSTLVRRSGGEAIRRSGRRHSSVASSDAWLGRRDAKGRGCAAGRVTCLGLIGGPDLLGNFRFLAWGGGGGVHEGWRGTRRQWEGSRGRPPRSSHAPCIGQAQTPPTHTQKQMRCGFPTRPPLPRGSPAGRLSSRARQQKKGSDGNRTRDLLYPKQESYH